jgi:hypothetical protein
MFLAQEAQGSLIQQQDGISRYLPTRNYPNLSTSKYSGLEHWHGYGLRVRASGFGA